MVNEKGAVEVRVNAREVDCGDDKVGSDFGSGFELGQNIGWVNEETRDGVYAGVDKAFNSDLGFVELLYFFHSVVFFVVNVGCHDFSLSLSFSFSLQLLRVLFFSSYVISFMRRRGGFLKETIENIVFVFGLVRWYEPDQPHNFQPHMIILFGLCG